MSRIADRFAHLAASNEKALVCFVTGGDPDVGQLPAILEDLEAGGADIIEVGIPFSDPIADGPTIQESSQRALDRGTKVSEIFEAVKSANITVPIVYMGYTNTAMRHGFQRFAQEVADSGADGVLLSDLTPEEAEEWKQHAHAAGLDTIFLAAPTSTDDRLRCACGAATGFVYCVSRTGVTGSEREVPREVTDLVARVRKVTSLPICVGFGISNADHVRMVCGVADGAVVGSHVVKLIHECWGRPHCEETLRAEVARLKSGTR